MKNLLFVFAIIVAAFVKPSFAQERISAVIPGDFADPSVWRKGNQYYAIGTSSEWAPHFPMYTSTNLKDWKQTGYVFDQAPEWTTGSFWAPEYFYHNSTYYIYYTARRKSDNASYIGVATSKFPDRGFKDHGVIIEHGKEAIDAFVYNEKGQLYITFKAYGLDNRPMEILGSKLSADGLKLEGELFTMFKDDSRIGLEGQSILKKDDYYYLFYSAGNCCGSKCDYNVRVARSKTFQGPYEDFGNNPVLAGNTDWKCSGHGTFVNTPQGKTFYLYHAYNRETTVYTGRQGMLAELTWPEKNGWPVFKEQSAAAKPALQVKDEFAAATPSVAWQWDFRNSSPVFTQVNDTLRLSGTIKEGNQSGIALTLRPVSTDFEMITTVGNQNSAQKGLIFYGDAGASVGVSARDDLAEFWIVKDSKRTVLGSSEIMIKVPVQLKMVVKPDLTCRVYVKQDQADWKELKGEGKPVVIDFLPQWDRSPRIGLNFKGDPDQDARFTAFELTNK
ncbi:glycoside hydrolase family 43 protein [Pedobacter ginsengisoli]|uniref:glycoside hydrolase family 43 protein n=1 Tax=Pedobacter ginsengisoli TaxID=363852 RepID=UPI00254B3732|nr:glycoside hydrolase family 43 protein [Pedobacter ginsengisoli]